MSDRAEGGSVRALEQVIHRGGGRLVGREENGQLLGVRNSKLKNLPVPSQLVALGVGHPQRQSGRRNVAVQSSGELGAGNGCEVGREPFEGFGRRSQPQVEDLLVGERTSPSRLVTKAMPGRRSSSIWWTGGRTVRSDGTGRARPVHAPPLILAR
jgi:hypothetical protein